MNIQIQGVGGSVCSPACPQQTCPSDVPQGVTAAPQCALQDAQSSDMYCALICSPSLPIRDQKLADAACGGANLSCKPISGTGICTYDDGDDDTPTDDDPTPSQDDDPTPGKDDDDVFPSDDDGDDDGDDDRTCEDAGSAKKCKQMGGKCHWCKDGLRICLKASWPCP